MTQRDACGVTAVYLRKPENYVLDKDCSLYLHVSYIVKIHKRVIQIIYRDHCGAYQGGYWEFGLYLHVALHMSRQSSHCPRRIIL